MEIDLNADLGEGAGTDAGLIPLISSANISCGAHAGDETTIRATIHLAVQQHIIIGAHPGYEDRANFGRVTLPEPPAALLDQLILQVKQLANWIERAGSKLQYIKPHGALYNQAGTDTRFAKIVCDLAKSFALPVMGLPESELEDVCLMNGQPFISEGFADRRYNPDGTLVPRTEPNAILHDVAEVVEQVKWITDRERVRSICVHGDTSDAVKFTAAVRDELLKQGFTIKAFV